MKRFISLFALWLIVASVSAKSPKYIFYFIGDGMGIAHVHMTQGALAAKDGQIGFYPLSFTQFPALGLATTQAANRLTTDSAAAGTALATGSKTSVGTIGMNTNHTENLESVAVDAKKSGRKVGVVTTVSIDHATPAAFYAHEKERNMYTEIASWIPKTDLDLYAGSGLIGKNTDSIYTSIANSGYTIVRGKNASVTGSKILWIQDREKNPANLPLAIDRTSNDMTLPDIVDKSIEVLRNNKGFFLMAEGGQIDWAAHANDAASILHEMVDFSDAIAVALKFYEQHPSETLIIVTADHETGGLALGRDDRHYDTNLETLFNQKGSKGIVGKEITRQTAKDAGVAFTSGTHTASPVPIYAIGVGSERFKGEMDNTDIPRLIRQLLNNK